MTTASPVRITGPRKVVRMAIDKPLSWDEASRSFEFTICSDADVGDGVRLSLEDGHFRFPSAPIPLTIDHSDRSEDVWGAISEIRMEQAGGMSVLVGRGMVDDRESEATEVALARLRNGSARFSVRARAHEWSLREEDYMMPVAIDWEMYETSLVLAGQDPVSILRSSGSSPEQAPLMAKETATITPEAPASIEPTAAPAAAQGEVIERSVAPAPAAAPAPSAPDGEVQRSAAEVRREADILRAGMRAGIESEKIEELVRSGKPFVDCATEIFTLMRGNLSQANTGRPVGLAVTSDQGDVIARGISDAIAYRLNTIKEPTELGRKFIRRRSMDLLESYLVSRGVSTDHLTANQIVSRAFHSTSDFPLLLADVASKRLMAGYEEEAQTWRPFAVQRNLPDFKPHNNVQLQGKLTLKKSLENGEYTGMSMVEGQATWQLATYRGKLLWTREMIINDDLNAFEKVIMMAGRGARITESDIVWELLTTGAITGGQTYGGGAIAGIDGAATFAQAHANTGAGVIGIAGMNTGRVAMGKQKDIAGNELNIRPAFLLVPTSLATTAEQFVYAPNYTPAKTTGDDGPNVFTNKVQVIEENRLETRSSANWFLVASPRQIETIEYGYLAGEEGPNITVTDRRDPDGAEMLVRMDFGAAVQDYRGFYRSTGA